MNFQRSLAGHALALLVMFSAIAGTARAASVPVTGMINSNFNGTSIPGGDFIWFNSVISPKNLGSSPVTFFVTNSHITFSANGTNFDLAVPDSKVTFSPTATTASTSYNAGTNSWTTAAPSNASGNAFLDGLSFRVPSGGLPGGINPVSWTADFSTDTSGATLQWQWGAAVFTNFSVDPNLLGVKPVDSNSSLFPHNSPFANGDHAGSPENFASCSVGGARGGGSANVTGSYSATGSVSPGSVPNIPIPLPAAFWTGMSMLLGLGALAAIRARFARAATQL